MAVTTEIKLMQLPDAHDAIMQMVSGTGPGVTPCATANGGEICTNATVTGCTSKRDEGLVYTSGGVECPRQLGTLIIRDTGGSAPVNPK